VIQEETGSGNYTKTILTNLKEERKTTLMIHEISLLQATNYISSTNEKIAELSAFSSTAKSSRLLTQMQTALEQKHYGDIRTLHETITKEYQAGRNAKRLLEQVKQDIAQAAYQGLDTPQSERLAKLANVALARGAYDIAQKHAEDAKTTVVLETSGKFNLFAYIVNHWLTFSLLVIFSSIITYVFFILVKYGLIKGRLLMLNKEQDIILALIKQLQLECFRDGAISMERYNLSLEQYEKKLGKLVHKIIHIETMKTYFFLFYVSKYQRLCREKARLLTMIKKTQKDYLLRQELETQDYERRIKIYSERLTEIEETIVELRAHRHMHHSVTWTQQFKNKKRKLDHE